MNVSLYTDAEEGDPVVESVTIETEIGPKEIDENEVDHEVIGEQ